jgi:hypothetical protein
MHLILDAPCSQGFEAYVGVLLLQTALHGLASDWQARMSQIVVYIHDLVSDWIRLLSCRRLALFKIFTKD